MEQVLDRNYRFFIYFFIVALDSLSFCLITPILAPLLSEHQLFFVHAGCYQYGLLMALFPLSYMLASPFIGYCSDRWGRKPLLLLCLIFMLLSFIAYADAFNEKSVYLLMFGRVLAGLGASSQAIAQAAIVDLAPGRQKPQAIAFIAIAMTLGLVLGPLLASQWSHRSSLIMFSVVSVLILINISLLSCVKDFSIQASFKRIALKTKLNAIGANSRLLSLLFIFFLFELGWSLYYQSLALLLSFHWHLTNQPIGWFCAYVGAVLSVFLIVGANSSLLIRRKNTVFFVLALGVGAFLLPILVSTFLSLIISAFIVAVSVAILYPSLMAELSDVAGIHQGFAIGLSGSLLALAFAITGFYSGFLVTLSDRVPLLLSALLWLFAWLSYYFLMKWHKNC